MRGKTVLDGRNVLNGGLLAELGFRYWSFGRGNHHNGNGSTPHENDIALPPIGGATQANANGATPHEDAIAQPPALSGADVE